MLIFKRIFEISGKILENKNAASHRKAVFKELPNYLANGRSFFYSDYTHFASIF